MLIIYLINVQYLITMTTLAFFTTDVLLVLIISVLVTIVVATVFWLRLKAVINYSFKWKELEIMLNKLNVQFKEIQDEVAVLKINIDKGQDDKHEFQKKLLALEARLKALEDESSSLPGEKNDDKQDIVVEYYMGNSDS
ncbi:hypothetical protein D1614_00780 [Maribellus luteus]|uniref:Uncharacterized protein n=1 Tax=Maribellus luteus TaxID=2305463 RepID=A0A399T989_9BACT|nr:hypothetical protein [Maribellus luteus]RIJ50503.1 hypothetical protein D1614_00780 [Maribellus luteus]